MKLKPKYIYGNVLIGIWWCPTCKKRWFPTDLQKLEAKPVREWDRPPAPFKCPSGCDAELKYEQAP